MRARLRAMAGPLWVLVATTVANVLAYGYQVVMARLLRPEEYAILTQFFGVLVVESLGAQVIQSATAKIAAHYRAREEDDALHAFVRRWAARILFIAGPPALAIVVLGQLLAGPRSPLFVTLLGAALFLAAFLTFAGGLLQGLARFGAFGWFFIAQAATRLLVGVGLVLAGGGLDGAFIGAAAALVAGLVVSTVALRHLFRTARRAVHVAELGRAETRFFLYAAVVMLAYAALANIDAVLSPALLGGGEAGAYAAAVTMGKVVLFAPIAVGFILLERTARAHARGEDTDRALFLALAFVLATSGAVTAAYAVAPAFFTAVVVGAQYPATAALVGRYGLAALSNALLSLWIAYFVGRGRMRVGFVLAAAVAVEVGLLVAVARDATTMVTIVLGVALTTQLVAVANFVLGRLRQPAGAATDARAL